MLSQETIDYLYVFDADFARDVEECIAGRDADDLARTAVEKLEAYEEAGNRWWLSDDPNVRAYYQLMEPNLYTNFGDFHRDVEMLLGHPVMSHEFGAGMGVEQLRDEARARKAELGF